MSFKQDFFILKSENSVMIIGKISENEKKVELSVEIHCTDCNKRVPGRILASEKYSQTKEFRIELENFKKDYLCGICRDKRRVHKNKG